MADRPQYPMMPNFNPGLMSQQQQQQLNQQQQQGQQQQQAQQQQDPHQPFPDSGRMWQQIQQFQYNRPPGAAGDMNQPQQNAQMVNEIRRQQLARMQESQMQQQQQFNLNGQQIGNMGGGPANGQQHTPNQPFLDAGGNQSQSPGFPAGVPNPAMQQQLNHNAAMLQAIRNGGGGGGQARQLEMLLAQNQPNQMNMAQRLDQQRAAQLQAMGQNPAGELFAPGVDRRPSPGHPNVQGPNTIGPNQQQPQQRKFNMNELNNRISEVRLHINNQERILGTLGAQRGMPPDAALLAKMRAVSEDIKTKKEYLGKLMTAMTNFTVMAQAQAQTQANGTGQASWNFNGTPQMQNSQPPNPTQVGQNNIPQGHGSPLNRSQAQLQQQQHLNRIASTGPPGSVPRPPSVQRLHQSGQMPAPGTGTSFAGQLSPGMNPQFPFPMGAGSPAASAVSMQSSSSGSMQLPPPLEKSRFDNAYKSFCANRGIKHDPRMINFEGRDIDLYMLHTHVMQEGGHTKINAQDLWGVVGGRMGFVQFPGSDGEPAKAGPGIAQRLAQVYREYLLAFDQVYISSVLDSKKKQMAAAMQAHHVANATNGNGAGPAPIPHPAPMTLPGAPGGPQRGALNSHQMQMVIGYANLPVEELRRQGVQDRIIQFVESNRAYLQRMAMEQGLFRSQFQNPGMRPPEQHGPTSVGPPFQNGSPHPNVASLGGQNPNFLQQNGMPPSMPGNNFMNNRPPQIPPQQHPNQPNGNMFNQQKVLEFLEKTKIDYRNTQARNPTSYDVPIEQRVEFNATLNQLCNIVVDVDKQLPLFYLVLRSEESLRKLIAIIVTVSHQRTLLTSNPNNPRFIVKLEILKQMLGQVTHANERLNQYFRSGLSPPNQQPGQQMASSTGSMPPNNHPMEMVRPPPPQQQQQQQQQQQHMPPQSLAPPNRPPANLRAPPVMKKPSGSTPGAVNTPTPPSYSASTPIASAQTPTPAASSPPAPKSPKGKAPAKPKNPPKRRLSVKNPQPSTPAPSATEQPPTPSSTNGKRAREEDTHNVFGASPGASGSAAANEPSPPKRPKTESEWGGGPISEAVTKKTEAIENIKTEEDASTFLEQMTELIKMAGEGQEALTTDISETLDQILKGYGGAADGSDPLLGFSAFGSLGEPSSQMSSIKPHPDEFVEFFDFSSFTAGEEENDADSKAPTPELSSTGPSPDSGSEADAAHQALLSIEPPVKTDELEGLRLGTWKDLDGGESSYFHSIDGWKWDSPMPTLEQPWAIFNS